MIYFLKRLPVTKSGFVLFLPLILSIIALLTACGGQPTTSEPPTISDPKISAPTPQEPGQEVGISVDVSSISGANLTYEWRVDGGEIVRGQGSPAITYRTPDEPGIYNVRVAVMWDNSSVEKITTIRVEAPEAEVVLVDEPPTAIPEPKTEDNPSPTATPQPPTATRQPPNTPYPTPKPTSTPRPTPIPTATIDSDPTVYDNFNNPANDGNFNEGRWEVWSDLPNQFEQQDGVLVIAQNGKLNSWTSLLAREYHGTMKDPTFFEAKLKMDPVNKAGWVILWIYFEFVDKNGVAACRINQDFDGYCEYADISNGWEARYETEYRHLNDGQFHKFKIEVDPVDLAFTFYLDDQKFGSYTPIDADKFKNRSVFMPSIGVANWAWDSTDPVVGYIDDVRIDQLGQ